MPSFSNIPASLLVGSVVVLVFLVIQSLKSPKRRNLPPGPKPIPTLGNAHQLPTSQEWITYHQWAKEFDSDVIYLNAVGQPIVILDSLEAAIELLDKRSSIYSDRPKSVFGGELVGFYKNPGFVPYGERFKGMRAFMQPELTTAALQKYKEFHEQEAKRMVEKSLADSRRVLKHIKDYAGATIVKYTYGYDPQPENDPWIKSAGEIVDIFGWAIAPGKWLVDLIPLLKYVPQWFPGAGFQRTAAKWSKIIHEGYEAPFRWTKKNHGSNTVLHPNFVSSIIDKNEGQLTPEQDDLIIWAAGALFGAGADTTVSAIETFYFAMAFHPIIQKQAQAEIDSVTRKTRLPTLADRPNLPFVNALIAEVMRWNPVTPLALPHRLTQDDIYKEYTIPADSIIIPNVWSMTHDPTTFPSPSSFSPSRFITSPHLLKLISSVSFGFGRRSCPGSNFAEQSLFMAIAMALAVSDISNATGESGEQLGVDAQWETGTISHPPRFMCTIRPREDVNVKELLS